VEVCTDLHLDLYYGDEDETEALYISQAKRGTKHRVARHGYAADALFIDTPRDAREYYSKRFGIKKANFEPPKAS